MAVDESAPSPPEHGTPSEEEARLFAASQGNHELIGLLGRGGMGTVFLTREKRLDRRVAFKQLFDTREAHHAELFLREAKITARLVHPGIVPVYALLDGLEGKPAYTMKVVEGRSLAELIVEARTRVEAGKRLAGHHRLSRRLEIFVRACEAIAFAHSRGIQHRDLKPANIMVGPHDEVYVVDWGLSGPLRHRPSSAVDSQAIPPITTDELHDLEVSKSAEELGTLGYASPERLERRMDAIDQRSDLYSLGVTLYELTYLKPAFPQTEPLELAAAMAARRVDTTSDVPGQRVPHGLSAAIKKAMAYRTEDRYATVAELADDVRRVIHDEPVRATRESIFRRAARLIGRYREAALIISLLGALCTVGLGGWWLWEQQTTALRARELTLETTDRLMAVAGQRREIDRLVYRFEGLLGRLSAAAKLALTQTRPVPETYYLHRRFNPPDLVFSDFYRDQVSVAWPVTKLAPGLEPGKLRSRLSRLATLRPHLREVVLDSAEVIGRPTSSPNPLVAGELPVLSAFVATDDGIMALYPGRAGYPADYDPRQRPWYQGTVDKRGVRWGRPYVSTQKIRAVAMGCTTALRDRQGELLGVAGIDLRLAYLSDRLGALPADQPWIHRALLVDDSGGVVARAGQLLDHVEGTGMSQRELARSPFWSDEVVDALRAGKQAGFVEVEWGGRVIFVAYTRLDALAWYYVVEGEPVSAD